MIGGLKGKIISKKDKYILLDVNNVAYKVSLSPNVSSYIKENDDDIFFYIHTHIKEDAMDLYGFLEYKELEFFEMLINVSGIGPKGALAILSIASIDTLKKAIKTSDLAYLTKISGIGRKTAEKIIIELRDKMEKENIDDKSLKNELDVLEALKSLGYSQNEVREVLKNIDSTLNTNSKIREALKTLGRK